MPDDRVPFPEAGLVVVPTLEGFQHLTERVTTLERTARATVPEPPAGPDRLELLERRVERHRVELEDIKRQWNELLRALGLVPPSAPTTTTPESYQ